MSDEKILKQRYQVGSQIRSTPTMTLWQGQDLKQDKPCLIKCLNYNPQRHHTSLLQMQQEAEQLRFSYHPQLSRMLDFWERNEDDGHKVYAVIDYGQGKSLHDWLKQGRTFSEKEVGQWLRELGKALNHLHSLEPPMYDGDLIPENLLITQDNQVQLLHFGPLRETTYNLSHIPELALFCAPEQLQSKPVTASDWFCLGQLSRYALERTLPKLDLEPHLRGNYSEEMHTLLSRMLEPEVENRLQTLDEMQTFMAGKTVFTKGSGPLPVEPEYLAKPKAASAPLASPRFPVKQSEPPQGSVLRLWGLGVLGILVVLAGFTFGGFFNEDHSQAEEHAASLTMEKTKLAEQAEEAVDETLDINVYNHFKYTEKTRPMGLPATVTPLTWSEKPLGPLQGEPVYQSKPRYTMVEMGTGEHKSLSLVLDGSQLYVDKNRNGDLSDEKPIAKEANGHFLATIELEVSQDGGNVSQPFRFGLNPDGEVGIYSACYYTGDVTIKDKNYPAVAYIQEQNKGLFQAAGLWIDLDQNGLLSGSEHYNHKQVFTHQGHKIRLVLNYP